ncbi:potassium channel subfamily K member 6-like [Centruroides vittatus]|uniref:potassium channel subfamily K member 6-like n=1 Tax=Centruroides vittatus TaxID=120091 RepID=UPI00350EAC71
MIESHNRAHEKRIFCIRRSNALLLLLTVFYVLYLIIGGAIFMKSEGPVEIQLKQSLLTLRNEFASKHPCVTEEALEHLIVSVVNARDQGIVVIQNVSDVRNKWEFGESIFFATTLITTIGYGHVTPLSNFGKGFTILYSVFGIPLTLILLAAFAERLMLPVLMLLRLMYDALHLIMRPFFIQFLHLIVIGTLIVAFLFILPSVLFTYLEPNWDFLDSFYFCYISLTTIGLGDLVPGESLGFDYNNLYKVFTSVYLLVGLTFMVMFLGLVAEIPQLNLGLLFLKKGDEITDDLEQMRLPLQSSDKYQRYLMPQTTDQMKASVLINQYDSYGDKSVTQQ